MDNLNVEYSHSENVSRELSERIKLKLEHILKI
jgi:hypothetical protein